MNTSRHSSSTGLWVTVILLGLALTVSLAVNGGLFLGMFMRWAEAVPDDLPIDEMPQFE